ncbi:MULTISPECIES: hypothetical protein [unclassified Pseudoalteromonas]|uniref:hypothetical protein n=1 Tax=unclassified Pseudoalteromonas TaxID=194690 RepID=UPI001602DB16|nr:MULTISPECIES: hypothetical protein [unclassified Pseudoalteromonas]MBB1334917.1 hypothetical protein [Pseudoalteromonas sp. SR41-6]MBB1461549.1 hypothetical protein [Pseudoalteromonas sp. SG41-8]
MFKGEDRPIRLHTNLNIVAETGGCLQSYYDGELILKVKGLWLAGKAVFLQSICTRHYSWKVEKT